MMMLSMRRMSYSLAKEQRRRIPSTSSLSSLSFMDGLNLSASCAVLAMNAEEVVVGATVCVGGGGKGTTSDQSTLEVLERAGWVEVQRLEHVRRHDRRRPEGDGRVDERLLQEACEGVADELRRE